MTPSQILSLVDDNIYGFIIPKIASSLEEPKEVRIVVVADGEPTDEVRFETEMDERVCPICEDLDSDVYLLEDDKPHIPEDTHPNCRCYYIYVDTGEDVPEDEIYSLE